MSHSATTSVRHSSPVLAAIMSAVVPGAGQWYAGERRRAVWLFVPFAAAIGLGVWLGLQGRVGLVVLLVQPAWVVGLAIANVALAVLRLGAAVDAYRVSGGRTSWPATAATALTLVALMVPHVVAGAYAADLLGLLRSVFVTDDPVQSAAASAARYRGAVALGSVPLVQPSGSIDPPGGGILIDQPDGVQRRVTPWFGQIPDPVMNPLEEEVDRITVLLAGGDAGPGRVGLRTDVMIVATLDLTTDRAALFSVSRELVGFPMPAAWGHLFADREELFWTLARNADLAGTSRATEPAPEVFEPTGIWPDRINAIYTYSTGVLDPHYPASPSPQMDALVDMLEITLGIPIPYWVLVDMEGFVDLVDAIGGVEVNALEPMHVTFSPEREGADMIRIDIDPGRYRLDGRLALAYVRNRSDSSDAVRTRRQRCMLREVAASADPLTILSNFGAITDAIREHTTTNIPLRFLPVLVEVAGGLDTESITTMAFQSGYYGPDSNYRGLHLVDVERVRAAVRSALDGMASGAPYERVDECS